MKKFTLNNRHASRLTENQVLEIRERYRTGRVTQGVLSREYGVSIVQIGRIVRGEVWQNVIPEVTDDEIRASAERLMKVQNATVSMREKLAQDIEREREKRQAGNRLVEELINQREQEDGTGTDNAGNTGN